MADGLRGVRGVLVQQHALVVPDLEHVRVQALHQPMVGKTVRE
jgi:hypothetical protein